MVKAQRYLVPFGPKQTPHFFSDILVIGAGIAGLRAALEVPAQQNVPPISSKNEVINSRRTNMEGSPLSQKLCSILSLLCCNPTFHTESVSEVDSHDIPLPHSGAGVQNRAAEVTPMPGVGIEHRVPSLSQRGGADSCRSQAILPWHAPTTIPSRLPRPLARNIRGDQLHPEAGLPSEPGGCAPTAGASANRRLNR